MLSHVLDEVTNLEEVLVNSGQHYDHNMSQQFFTELDIPKPKYDLDVKSSSQARQVGLIMTD